MDVTDKASRQHAFSTHVLCTLSTKGAVLVVGFAMGVITARYLGPVGVGRLSVLSAFTGIAVQFGNLGMNAANTYFAAREPFLAPAIAGNSLFVGLGGGTIIAVIATIILIVHGDIGASIPLPLAATALAATPFALFGILAGQILLGLGNIRQYNLYTLITVLIPCAAIIPLLIIFRGSVEAVVRASTACAILSAGVVLIYLHLNTRIACSLHVYLLKRMLTYGGRAYLAALFSFLLIRFDMLMVNRMLGATAAGIYSAAGQISGVIATAPVTVGTILFPWSASMDGPTSWQFTRKVLSLTVLYLALICLGIAAAAPWITHILYGPAFNQSATVLRWLLPGTFAIGMHTILANHLAGRGMPAITFIGPFSALFMNIALNLLLLPRLGVRAAALNSSLACGTLLAISLLYTRSFHARPDSNVSIDP